MRRKTIIPAVCAVMICAGLTSCGNSLGNAPGTEITDTGETSAAAESSESTVSDDTAESDGTESFDESAENSSADASGAADSSSADEDDGKVNGKVKALKILETGGEDGRYNTWKVYSKKKKYYLSLACYYGDEDPQVVEISKEEYKEIMNTDFDKCIADYDPEYWEDIQDAVEYETVLTCKDGSIVKTRTFMLKTVRRLNELLQENSVEEEYYYW